MKKDAKGVKADRSGDRKFSRTEDNRRPDGDDGQTELRRVLIDEFVLLELGVYVGIVAKIESRFNRTAFIECRASTQLEI